MAKAASRTDRTPIRTDAPEPAYAREPVRATARARVGTGTDKFHIPDQILAKLGAEGWDLQWNVDSVLGRAEPQTRMAMEVQGWTSVTGLMWDGLFDGRYMPKGYAGEIIVEGLVLQARPMELTLEARADENKAARNARFVEEQKIQRGTPDGVNLDLMNPNHGSARQKTFLNKERLPSMPIAD